MVKPINVKFLVILFSFLIGEFFLFSTPYLIRNYFDRDGLSSNVCATVVRGPKGYIWIGTQEGLNRFDGVEFKVFKKSPKVDLPHNFINALFVDSKKRLWIGTRNGLAFYQNGKFTSLPTQIGMQSNVNNIICIAETKNNEVIVGTGAGLCLVKGRKLVKFPIKGKEQINGKVVSIAVDQMKRIFGATPDDGLFVIENEIVRFIGNGNKSEGRKVSCLLADEGDLWVGTDSGLLLYENLHLKKIFSKGNSELASNGINCLFKDVHGAIWVGTQYGLNKIVNGTIETFGYSDGLAGSRIRSVCQDHEAGIWIGMSGGLSHLVVNKFKIYSRNNGFPSNSCYGIYQHKDGNFWIATYEGIVVLNEKKKEIKSYTTYNTNDTLSSNTVRTIAGDKKTGSIWIGTYGGGLVRFKNNKFESFNKDDGLPNNDVRVVYVDKKDRLWFGFVDGGLVQFDTETCRVLKYYNEVQEPKLSNNNVWFIEDDSKGNLWIGVDEGINRLNNGEIKHFGRNEGLNCKDTHDILEVKGGYWIATFGAGLYYFDEKQPEGNQFEQFTTKDGLPNNYVYKIIRDSEGYIWLPTNLGVFRWNRKRGQEKEFLNYTVENGFPSNENNAHGGVVDSKKRIWFSTHRGLAVLDPAVDIPPNKSEPFVYIEEVIRDGKLIPINNGQRIELEASPERIYFKFTALSYKYPEAVEFKIRLNGFDSPDEWLEPLGQNRFVEYTKLPPGDYDFHVIACNNDGVWNFKGASFKFRIKSRFYQTLEFKLIVWLAILGLFWVFYRFRIHQQKMSRKRLESMVESRTRELKEAQAQLVHQGKMALLGEMAAGVAHEMNNPANYIYGNADFLQKYISDIKKVLLEYMKLDLPLDHKINLMRKELSLDEKIDELGDMVNYVKEGSVRISEIVKNLRFFVGKDHLEFSEMDVHENLETSLSLLQNKIKNRIEIIRKFETIPLIEGSSSQLNQVFMNLLSNAADAISGNGEIVIETGLKDSSTIRIRISDSGSGIIQSNLDKVFEPFFTTKTNHGMGLGLSISKRVIEEHNGKISVESIENQGTTFIIELPTMQEGRDFES